MTKQMLSVRSRVAIPLLLALVMSGCAMISSTFETTCGDIGKPPSNVNGGAADEVIVLLDVSDNHRMRAEKMAADVGAVLDEIIDTSDHVLITGFASGGSDGSMSKVGCMDGDQYFFSGGNRRRQEAERDDLKQFLKAAMITATVTTEVETTGDYRPLVRQAATVLGSRRGTVILWSDFLSQGRDCLEITEASEPNGALAERLVERCAEMGLLPSLPSVEMFVVGSGVSEQRPDLSSFGRSLGAEMCNRIAQTCEIR